MGSEICRDCAERFTSDEPLCPELPGEREIARMACARVRMRMRGAPPEAHADVMADIMSEAWRDRGSFAKHPGLTLAQFIGLRINRCVGNWWEGLRAGGGDSKVVPLPEDPDDGALKGWLDRQDVDFWDQLEECYARCVPDPEDRRRFAITLAELHDREKKRGLFQEMAGRFGLPYANFRKQFNGWLNCVRECLENHGIFRPTTRPGPADPPGGTMADPSDPTCPKGVPEEDVADFATGDIDDGTSKRLRAHLAECGACRGLYAEYRVTMLALRRRAAPSEAAPPRAWWRLGRLRWAGAAAAALVLGVLAVQTGLAGRLLRAVVHLVGGATGEGSFEDAARRILALDRDGAGIPPDARIRRDFCDIRSAPGRTENGPPGTLVVHERHDGPTVVLGIAAFAPDGSKLWALGDAGVLPRWGRLLPGRQYGLAQLRTFASGGLNGDRREVAVATVLRPPESALLLFDPATGRELAIVGRRVPVAVDADVPPGAQSPVPLPPDAGGVRNLLVCCSIHVSPTETAPAALVISPEGRLLQLARFPRTPVRPERGSVAVGARVRWPRGDAPGEVTVFTSEEVEWRFAVLDGLLVAESVTAALADAFPALWDRTVRETTHAARFPDPGSADEFLSGLERGVAVERDPPEEKVWLE